MPGHRTVAVVLNHNAGRSLAECVAALAAARGEGAVDDFLVLDNGSGDGSFDRELIRSAGGTPLAFGANLGFGAAHNRVLGHLRGCHVLFLNPDAVALPGGIRAMRTELEEGPGLAAVGGAIELPDGSFQPSAFPEPSLGWALAHLLRLKDSPRLRRLSDRVPALARAADPYVTSQGGKTRDVDWVVGACVLVRGEALADVGGFDERFFLYFEEIDWCRRARERGWRIRYLPEVAARHQVGGSSAGAPAAAAGARYRSMRRYFGKHHGVAIARLLRLAGVFIFGPRFLLHPRDEEIRAGLMAFLSPR